MVYIGGCIISDVNTRTALKEANELANQILYMNDGGSTTVHHDHYHWGSPFWGWGYPYPVYESKSSSKESDNSWIALPATLIALGSLYFIGQNHAEWAQAKEKLAKLQARAVDVQKETIFNSRLQRSMQTVFSREMGLLDHLRAQAARGLFYKGVLATSAIAAGVGALVSSPLLIAGTIGSLGAGGIMLYRAGFSSQDFTLQEEARDLKQAVTVAENSF